MTREEVKALIAEKITTNGEGAITAEVLADVLNAVVDEGVLDASHLNRGDEISEEFVQKMENAKELIHPDLWTGKGFKITSMTGAMVNLLNHVAQSIASGATIRDMAAFGSIKDETASVCVCAAVTAFASGGRKHYFFTYEM